MLAERSGYRLYREFLNQKPDIVVEWKDETTSAKAWLVINSLRGGAAGGGTRMRCGGSKAEATFLAKTMEIKFGVSGPLIGGAKSVIDFDDVRPAEERQGVLRRWFEFIARHLQTHYGTGGDLNVDELNDVMPLTAEMGLGHPQEGIVRGHFTHLDEQGVQRVNRQLGLGLRLRRSIGEREFELAQLVTGYGVSIAARCWYEHQGDSLAGKRVLIEGFGDVGGSAAYYLQQEGARVVGIISKTKSAMPFRWQIDPDGLDAAALLAERPSDKSLPAGEEASAADVFWRTPADLFVPAAQSETIDAGRLEQLAATGVRVIACGANFPFAGAGRDGSEERNIEVQMQADAAFAVIPDFIANCGMARTFAYLMVDGNEVRAEPIYRDVEKCIRDAVANVLGGSADKTGLLDRAYLEYVPRTGAEPEGGPR